MAQAVIIDVIIAAILLLAIMLGAYKGFLKSVAGLVILLVSLAGAAPVSNVVTPLISEAVKPMLVETIENNLPELAYQTTSNVLTSAGMEEGSDYLIRVAKPEWDEKAMIL